eukprot:623641-Pleurochrysis_carterae.AAC.1
MNFAHANAAGFSNTQSSWAQAISSAHDFDPGAQYCDMRGKHDRTNMQKTQDWKTKAANHF